jgi:hypothetical protein
MYCNKNADRITRVLIITGKIRGYQLFYYMCMFLKTILDIYTDCSDTKLAEWNK